MKKILKNYQITFHFSSREIVIIKKKTHSIAQNFQKYIQFLKMFKYLGKMYPKNYNLLSCIVIDILMSFEEFITASKIFRI